MPAISSRSRVLRTSPLVILSPMRRIRYPEDKFPDPVIEVAVEPKTAGDQEKMGVALSRSHRRPTGPSDEKAARPSSTAWASCIRNTTTRWLKRSSRWAAGRNIVKRSRRPSMPTTPKSRLVAPVSSRVSVTFRATRTGSGSVQSVVGGNEEYIPALKRA